MEMLLLNMIFFLTVYSVVGSSVLADYHFLIMTEREVRGYLQSCKKQSVCVAQGQGEI